MKVLASVSPFIMFFIPRVVINSLPKWLQSQIGTSKNSCISYLSPTSTRRGCIRHTCSYFSSTPWITKDHLDSCLHFGIRFKADQVSALCIKCLPEVYFLLNQSFHMLLGAPVRWVLGIMGAPDIPNNPFPPATGLPPHKGTLTSGDIFCSSALLSYK